MYTKHIKAKKNSWGGQVFAMPFPTEGLVSVVISLIGGSIISKNDALSAFHSSMLLEGTQMHSKRELQLLLDEIGASVSFSTGHRRITLNARVRSQHLAALFSLIAEILQHPSFPPHELEILKKRTLASLTLKQEDPNVQARIGIRRLLYPKDHPNFSPTTKEERGATNKISSNLLKQFHKKILNKNSLVVSVVGHIKPEHIFKLVEKIFSQLPDKKVKVPKSKKAIITKPQKLAIPIKNKASITYIAGITTTITNIHRDYPSLLLGMEILGGNGFVGRLMNKVRDEKGLSYGVYSYVSSSSINHALDGHLELQGTFAPNLFKKGRGAMLEEALRITTEPVQKREVDKFKRLFVARLKVRLSNSMALASAIHSIITNEQPLSELDEFPKRILKLTENDVNRSLRKYLKPELLSEVAAGPVDKNSFKL